MCVYIYTYVYIYTSSQDIYVSRRPLEFSKFSTVVTVNTTLDVEMNVWELLQCFPKWMIVGEFWQCCSIENGTHIYVYYIYIYTYMYLATASRNSQKSALYQRYVIHKWKFITHTSKKILFHEFYRLFYLLIKLVYLMNFHTHTYQKSFYSMNAISIQWILYTGLFNKIKILKQSWSTGCIIIMHAVDQLFGKWAL